MPSTVEGKMPMSEFVNQMQQRALPWDQGSETESLVYDLEGD